MSKITDKLNDFKGVIAFVVFIVGSYVGMIVHIEKAVAEEAAQIKAQAALIHDDIYLSSRVKHNEIEKELYESELDNLEEYLEDDEPTPREQRKLEYLRAEIARLRADSEVANEHMREKIKHSNEDE